MSRGFVLGVLSTVFVVGGAAGYLVRGSGSVPAEPPPLARGSDGLPPVTVPPAAPSRSPARITGVLRAVPTPGAFYRLADKETLSDVAKRAYGSTRRLPDLLAVNASLDPKHLAKGTLVYVPLGIEPIPMPPADVARPDVPKPEAPKPAPRSASSPSAPRAASEPAPLFAKPK